jgi:hypothetical protein
MFTMCDLETSSHARKNSGIDRIEIAVLSRCVCPLVIVAVSQPPD